MENIKLGLIGYGYWGKILYKNLTSITNNIFIYDINTEYNNLNIVLDNCKNIFVATPTSSHYQICQQLLTSNKNVFCEKPLTDNLNKTKTLFNIAKQTNSYLFVDWTFLFNNHVKYIKNIIEQHKLGNLKSINMNRLNLGPVRYDVSAKLDLVAHDVSILIFLLGQTPTTKKWIEYKRNTSSVQNDSCIGLLQFNNTFAQINCSWHYGQKDRMCIFEFDNGFLTWNDITQQIIINQEEVNIISSPPLTNSIRAFLNQTIQQTQIEKITTDIEKTLSENT